MFLTVGRNQDGDKAGPRTFEQKTNFGPLVPVVLPSEGAQPFVAALPRVMHS